MIHWEVLNNIGIISLDNYHGNLLSFDDLYNISIILEEKMQLLDGLILTGLNRSFCTGLEVKMETAELSFKLLDEVLLKLYSLEIPLTIALSGHAIGAGFLMLCCADYIVALDNEKTKFGLPEIKLGLGLDKCMFLLLSTCLSNSRIEKIVYSGDYFSHRRLLEWEIIDDIKTESLIDACEKYIKSIYENKSFSFCKNSLRHQHSVMMNSAIQQGCYIGLVKLFSKKQ